MARTSVELALLFKELDDSLVGSPSMRPSGHFSGRRSSVEENGQYDLEGLLPEKCAPISKGKTVAIIASVTCVTGMGSFLAGLVTVAIPIIVVDLRLDQNLLLWPASIYALTCGCSLLLLGSVADVVGSRPMYLFGCLLQCLFTFACGVSKTGPVLIVFRGLSGIAASFCLPSAVSIINSSFPVGRRRNRAFAWMGGGQPIGYCIGLTLGGSITSTVGWQWGFHLAAVVNLAVFILASWRLPKNEENSPTVRWERVVSDVDWLGALIASASLAMLSYVFASVTDATSNAIAPLNIWLSLLGLALVPCFVLWVGRQERLHRPALIPNTLWHDKVFTSIILNVFFTWGAFNAFEQFLNFFLQEIQKHSVLEAALRLGPAPIAGILTSIVVGLIVHRVRADWIVIITAVFSCLSPLLMAIVKERWSYWACAFPAISLIPIGMDALFIVSNLLITSRFPATTQGLAGGVFNTIAQIGKSMGLALAALIANSITAHSSSASAHHGGLTALMEGYRGAFWFCFAINGLTLGISLWGLRKVGMVGGKKA